MKLDCFAPNLAFVPCKNEKKKINQEFNSNPTYSHKI
jgi:uncharacterized protein YktA (UPF0223 family)